MDYLRFSEDSWFLKIPSLPFLLFPTWLLVYARLDNSVFRAFSLYQSYPSLSEFPVTSFLLLFPALVALHSRKGQACAMCNLPTLFTFFTIRESHFCSSPCPRLLLDPYLHPPSLFPPVCLSYPLMSFSTQQLYEFSLQLPQNDERTPFPPLISSLWVRGGIVKREQR